MGRRIGLAFVILLTGCFSGGCSGQSEPQGRTITAAEMKAKGGDAANLQGGGPGGMNLGPVKQ
jgi:hypothetical protein